MTLGCLYFQIVPLTSEPASSIIAVAASLRENRVYSLEMTYFLRPLHDYDALVLLLFLIAW